MRCCSVSEAGTQSRSHDYSSLQPAHLEFPSTDSKTFKEVMGPEGSLLRSLDPIKRCRNHIPGIAPFIPFGEEDIY